MRPGSRLPVLLQPGVPVRFPDPRHGDDDGLLAIGGDLSVATLVEAYTSGIFPWFNDGHPPLWWSPNPRAVLRLDSVHISRSMRRRLRQQQFELTCDRAFLRVMQQCGQRKEGTWILPEMMFAYDRLHHAGQAHSFEVWQAGELVGGLYGVQVGGLFAAESMFHRKTDASKIALIAAVHSLRAAGVTLFDVQFRTPHLQSLGVEEISREQYLSELGVAVHLSVDLAGLVPAICLDT